MKKADITLTTVIVAVLVILVLVVLILIFSKNMGVFSVGAAGCSTRNGQCDSYNEDNPQASCQFDMCKSYGCAKIKSLKGCGDGEVCCVPIAIPKEGT